MIQPTPRAPFAAGLDLGENRDTLTPNTKGAVMPEDNTRSVADAATLVECGDGVAVVMPGHDDHRAGLAWRTLGKDVNHRALGVCIEIWLVRDLDVEGFEEWFWRCEPDHTEAMPFTVWSDHYWPVDIDAREGGGS